MESSEPWFFACFYGLLGILILCLFLWTAQNPACLPAFMNFVPTLLRTLEPFSALLGILRLCMFLLTDRNPPTLPAFMKMSKLWFFACFLNSHVLAAWPKFWAAFILGTLFPLCLEHWNPFLLCLEPCVFYWFYGLLRNPDSLPVSMDYSEACFIICFYGLIGIHISGCF